MIIFLFLRWGQVPILRSIQYITYKYGDFQKASRISHVETSIPINSIGISKLAAESFIVKAEGARGELATFNEK